MSTIPSCWHLSCKPTPQTVKLLLKEKISALCPAPLADRVLESVFASLTSTQIADVLVRGLAQKDLLDHLFAEYERAGFLSPEKDERQALGKLLDNHNHGALESLLLIWGGGKWTNPVKKWRIKSGLEDMTPEAYRHFWELAVPNRMVDPMDLLVDGKEILFTRLLTESGMMDTEDVPKIVKTLVEAGATDALESITPYIQNLDNRQLKKVIKHTRDLSGLPPAFVEALALTH